MITLTHGNLLTADVEAIVNTVNCVGVMGKGIALQFRQAFPANFDVYEKACKAGNVHPGKMHVFSTGEFVNPKYIINFPTKTHWRAPSKLAYVEDGLADLVRVISDLHISSIAIPPLGCGNGGLRWSDVLPLIETAMGALTHVDVHVYPPEGAPASDAMPVRTERPKMTRARALFIKLIEQYNELGYRLSLLEIQKLAYFLQEAGEKLRLNYSKHIYGPYADNLNQVLVRLEGHFIRGFGDRSGDAQIYLLDGAIEEADAFLGEDREGKDRLAHVKRVVEGFETPYGVELLATVHWLSTHEGSRDYEDATKQVQAWSDRKSKLMKPRHIEKAWKHLADSEFLPRPANASLAH